MYPDLRSGVTQGAILGTERGIPARHLVPMRDKQRRENESYLPLAWKLYATRGAATKRLILHQSYDPPPQEDQPDTTSKSLTLTVSTTETISYLR